MKALVLVALVALVTLVPGTAAADGDPDLRVQSNTSPDQDSPWPTLQLTGAARLRAGYLENLDLDRGLTPSGQALFPVPDPSAQAIAARDMRLRTDLTARSRGGTMDVKLRIDVLDDVGLGGTSFAAASGRLSDTGATIKLRRAYTEILTPLGVVVAGRMASQFGLGMIANSGDCLDCDGGETADRVGLVIPVRGYFVAAALDLSSTANHFSAKTDDDPRHNPHAVSLGVMRYRSDEVRAIRRRGGRTTVDFGGAAVYVWQDRDTPADYLLADPGPMPATMARGLSGLVSSGWLRLERPGLRIEAEGAVVAARIAQASLIPGLLLRTPVEMLQTGFAMESDLGPEAFGGGLDAGYASGDPAPGFGAFPTLDNAAAQPGDLDGSQARPPGDHRIDNFRFDPNYRIDRILFHQIIGTVTDAIYIRPHARVELAPGLALNVAAIASWAIEPTSTPSGQRALGFEVDSDLTYHGFGGWVAQLAHAVLFPGAGFDGPMLPARAAQSVELLVRYAL